MHGQEPPKPPRSDMEAPVLKNTSELAHNQENSLQHGTESSARQRVIETQEPQALGADPVLAFIRDDQAAQREVMPFVANISAKSGVTRC
jgi:hypothetical protein